MRHDSGEKLLCYNDLCTFLMSLKHTEDTSWLSLSVAQVLQQALKDLCVAYKNMFEDIVKAKKGLIKFSDVREPKFKKKHKTRESFRFPQGFKLNGSSIFLPKVGWVRYFKSRGILGTLKNVTVSLDAGHWYASIQTEREIQAPVHHSASMVGIDMGVANFAVTSDREFLAPLNSFRKLEKKLAWDQRKLARKVKFSANWKKQKARISRLHSRIADARNDYLHKHSTTIAKNHGTVVLEALQVSNMSKSAAGTQEAPGRNVKAKSGLNKAILDQGWGNFRLMLGYKLRERGGFLLQVPAQYTSQTCPDCGHVDPGNRKTQAKFECLACGFAEHADFVGALNILAAGQAVSACGEAVHQGSSRKQEPARRVA